MMRMIFVTSWKVKVIVFESFCWDGFDVLLWVTSGVGTIVPDWGIGVDEGDGVDWEYAKRTEIDKYEIGWIRWQNKLSYTLDDEDEQWQSHGWKC